MQDGKKSIAEMTADSSLPKASTETVFEGDVDSVIYRKESPFISKMIIKYSFGLITRESQINKILALFVGVLFSVAIIIFIRTTTQINKVPNDVLKLNMERMRAK